MTIQRAHQSVFFPWERRQGLRSVFSRARVRQVFIAGLLLTVFILLNRREHRAADVRTTRLVVTATVHAVDAWRADHEGACPGSLADLVAGGYLRELPRDAWGRLLRVTCPGRSDAQGFEVTSDGPDGLPGGLDRVQ